MQVLHELSCKVRTENLARNFETKVNPFRILKGYQIFHNYLRPHMGLDGDTPANRCGIEIQGWNKWITLIQNASRK